MKHLAVVPEVDCSKLTTVTNLKKLCFWHKPFVQEKWIEWSGFESWLGSLCHFSGSRDGAVMRALVSHQCGLFASLTWHLMWLEFVVGSLPCSKDFSPRSAVFLPPQKPALQFPIWLGISGRITTLWMCHSKFLFIILFIYLFIYLFTLSCCWTRQFTLTVQTFSNASHEMVTSKINVWWITFLCSFVCLCIKPNI